MIAYVELERILPNPWQTRGEVNAEHIEELAKDIEANGLLQRPVGRLLTDGQPIECNLWDAIGGSGELGQFFQVQLAFGHNRLAAFRLLAEKSPDVQTIHHRMPVDIFWMDDEKMAQAAWSENEKRRDLTPIERARAIEKRMADFAWTHEQAAERLELGRTTVSNILRLLELPVNIQEALGNGELSERSAMALLPLYDVPEEIRRRHLYVWGGPEKIVEQALDGASSEAIRKQVNDYFGRNFTALDQKLVGLDDPFPEGGAIYCGLCRTCDKRMASRNLCLDQACYDAKLQVVRHRYLEKASLTSGYEIINEQKGGYPSSLPSSPERLEKIKATKCPNLRLAYDLSWDGRDDPRRIVGHPKALLVCDKRNDSCTCVKGIEKLVGTRPAILNEFVPEDLKGVVGDMPEEEVGVPSPPAPPPGLGEGSSTNVVQSGPTPAELEAVMRKARQDKKDAVERAGEIQQRLAKLLAQELAQDSLGAFYVLIRGYVWMDRQAPSLESLYREAGANIARRFMPNNFDSVAQIMEFVNGRLGDLGLPMLSPEKRLSEVFEEADEA